MSSVPPPGPPPRHESVPPQEDEAFREMEYAKMVLGAIDRGRDDLYANRVLDDHAMTKVLDEEIGGL
jgi:hypothetical protein